MTLNKKMPARRQRILDFIQTFIEDNGLPPTVRDIQKACEISSTSVVDYNLRILDRDGFLNRRPDVARGIELLDDAGQPVGAVPRVQIVGRIAAGSPLPVFSAEGNAASQEFESIEVAPDLPKRHGRLFALEVQGQSMIDALIDDGDVVVIKPSHLAEPGEMVVAWLKDEEEATLKKFYPEGDQVRLQPANSSMDPIRCSAGNVEIRGKVVSVIRKFG
ncbi:MAG: transcriptional repressor LexA [Chloroflexota bacterium]|nr:transcriptional repressor LexA [Chloroflexota bacterium]